MLHFLGGVVAAQRLTVAMEHKRTYLLARTSGKTTARPPDLCGHQSSSAVASESTHHASRLQIFDGERLITEVQKRPEQYNKATPEYSDKNCKEKLWTEVCEAVVPTGSKPKQCRYSEQYKT